jgi:hypothetical protein
MDDFRRRYDVPRRDFGLPADQPAPQTQPEPPVQPEPTPPEQPHQPHHRVVQHPHQSAHHPRPAHHQTYQPEPQPALIDDLRPTTQHHKPQPIHHQPPVKKHRGRSQFTNPKAIKVIAGVIVLLLVIFAVSSLKPSKTRSVLPADLAKKATFSIYYPSSLPPGFSYDKTISTFQGGQAYYLLNKGTEHVVVREQAWSSNKLDTSSLTNPEDLPTGLGKAAIGTNTGQTAATVLAGTTLINITSNGSVSKDEMMIIINNLKNISPNHG